jgi:hypothetical protein
MTLTITMTERLIDHGVPAFWLFTMTAVMHHAARRLLYA